MSNGKNTAEQKKAASAKMEKFKHLASRRMTKAIAAIQNVARLSRPASYAYTSLQAEQIVNALRSEVDNVEEAFKAGKGGAATGFSFE